jgi:hypothetical protein
MRINKSILIYVRMLIVGLVCLFGLLTIIASGPEPKPTPRLKWVKHGATDQDYKKDNYTCLKESQQRFSESSREGRSASSSSTMQTNDSLWNACMNAHGWSLQEYETEAEKAAKAAAKAAAKKAKAQAREIKRDGRFIAYDNGTVLDTRTKLLWAAKDNGADITWSDAKNYCDNYRRGGYIDWRMPTQDELATLNDSSQSKSIPCNPKASMHVATKLIDITCYIVWASVGDKDFNFKNGEKAGNVFAIMHRALPVRDE